jgi:phospholipid/cholesterol/gamma-HCH transport system substrate-binding protein
MKDPFRARNPLPIALVGMAVVVALLIVSLRADDIFSDRSTYSAEFAEAANINDESEVRIAGVRVGMVESVELAGDRVLVEFTVDNSQDFGDRTDVAIKTRTLLGQKYLDIRTRGDGEQDPDEVIPLSRTETPYQIFDAFGQLGEVNEQLDADLIAEQFTTLADTFRNTPESTRASLDGLSRLSNVIAERDMQLAALLESTKRVTAVLAERDDQLVRLLADGDLVLATINERREAISSLLANTIRLSEELTRLVRDNRLEIGPLLDNLDSVTSLLEANLDNLDKTLDKIGPFFRYATSSLGNGQWLDIYAQNLFLPDGVFCEMNNNRYTYEDPATGETRQGTCS